MDKKLNNRFGERKIMKCSEECEIIEYKSATDMIVKFLKTGELVKCEYGHFKNGEVKSHFTPTVFGVGIVGLELVRDKEGKLLRSYQTWADMLRRCYDERLKDKHLTYKGCEVCEEWKYYKNFKRWYDENYYEIEGQKMHLDKDILVKGNKIYSINTCIFVPVSINSLFTKKQNHRGDLPIGVSWHKQKQKYQASCSIFNINNNKYKQTYLGYYNNPSLAFQVYKKAKEENIKQVADFYKGRIPDKLYKAMYNYEVEITD